MLRRATPRNHTRRVEDLQELERQDLLRYLEARTGAKGREYVVQVAGEMTPRTIPASKLDDVLDGIKLALTAIRSGATKALRAAGHGTPSEPATEER